MALKNSEKESGPQALETGLSGLFRKTFGSDPDAIAPLGSDGSARRLFRLGSASRTVIGAYGPDKLENRAFMEFSRHFRKEGMPVPEIFAFEQAAGFYLEEDLGDTTLFQFMQKERTGPELPPPVTAAYRKTLDWLPKFQTLAGKNLDYSYCYPRAGFDRQSIMWDLSYFKYYFLRLAKIPFNEQKLEDDFNLLASFLLEADSDFFLYRDFQSRNVMLRAGEPWFIDYQGGRKGARQYDLASILYDAKADIRPRERAEFVRYYLDAAGCGGKTDRARFMRHFHAFAFVRIMQAMGAYGLRGFYEGKTQFLQSVPYAVRNIEWLLENAEIPLKLPELLQVLRRVASSSRLRQFGKPSLGLTARITSFAYRNGVPSDEKGHGGGFVFDCRALPNPGRLEQYAQLTGKDDAVKKFLEGESAVSAFLEHVFGLIDASVENYLSRNFTDLMVSFGCTGGRHRSVYCAEALARRLREKYKATVELTHRESGAEKKQ